MPYPLSFKISKLNNGLPHYHEILMIKQKKKYHKKLFLQ